MRKQCPSMCRNGNPDDCSSHCSNRSRPFCSLRRSGSLGGEGVKFKAADEDLGPFGLDENLARRRLHVEPFIGLDAVDAVNEMAAVTDHVQAGPLFSRTFDVLLAAEAQHVLPIGVTAVPVDPPEMVERDPLAPLFPDNLGAAAFNGLGRKRDGNVAAVGPLALNHEQVAGAAFDDLGFDAAHENATKAPVGLDTMDDNAGIPGICRPRRPSAAAPTILDHQVIILVALLGRDLAKSIARDMEHTVFNGEDLAGIFVLGIAEPSIKAVEVLAVEQFQHDAFRADRLGVLAISQAETEKNRR